MTGLDTASAPHHPIILAGGGLSAKIMAICLHHSHIPFLWCAGKHTAKTNDYRTTTIHDAGMKMLEALGIAAHCKKPLWPINTIQVSDNDASMAKAESWPLHWHNAENPLAFVVQNNDLAEACESILSSANIKPSRSHIESLALARRSVVLEDGQTHLFDLLVICAGARTHLSAQAGFTIRNQEAGQTALVGTLECSLPVLNTAFQRFLPSGPIALMPMDEKHYSLVWTLPDHQADHILACPLEEQNQAVNQAFGEGAGHLQFIEPPQRWKLAPTFVPKIAKSGCILAGDSAHSLHPLAGMGLNLGLADAATLLDCLNAAKQQGLSASHPFIPTTYQRKRVAEILAMSTATQALNQLFSRPQGLARITAGMGMSIFGRSAFMKPIKQLAMGGKLSKPSLFSGRLP